MQRVEDTAPQGHQRDEEKIRERDPRQRYRQLELMRLARETGRQHFDHLRREHKRKRQKYRLGNDQ